MSLYRLDEDVQRLLTLDRFAQDDFSVRQFIETMSSSQAHAIADNELDPKPYIRTFEAVANELEKLLEKSRTQERQEEKKTVELQEMHNWNVIDLASNVDNGMNSIKNLDTQITEISRATAQMSEQLNRLSQEHESVISLRSLIQYYLNFLHKGECPELLRLWNSEDPADHRKCANAVGKLQLLARKIDDQQTEDKINEFAENLERYLISLFQDSYSAFDLVGMREIAQVLYDFNQGSSAVQVFINQHPFFMQVDRIEDDRVLKDAELWSKLADPASDHVEFEQTLAKISEDVTENIINETDVITRVFPRPTQVLSVFMQRVFAQYIQGQVLLYIQEGENRSPLAQARVLYVCYQQISLMVKSLKDTWNKQKIDLEGELSQVLDSNFADIFTMFVNDRYFADVEVPILTQVCCDAFEKFMKSHNVSLDRSSSKYWRDSSHGAEDGDDQEDASTMDRLMRAMRSSTTLAHTKSYRRTTVTEESMLQMSDLQLVLSSFAETVGRVQVLRPRAEGVEHGSALFNLIMENIGARYINVAFEDAIEKTNQDHRGPLDWRFLDIVRRASNSVQLVSAFVKSVLFAMVRISDATLAEMADNTNQYVSSTQEQCSYILERAAELYENRVIHCFSSQKKRDLAPKDTDTIELDKPSNTAIEIMNLLETIYDAVKQALHGPNLEAFLHSLSVTLYDALLSHLKKNQINPTGARILENDIAEYEQIIINEWKVDASDSFATLRAIAKIFSADAKMLPSLLKDTRLQRFKPSMLREYVMLRPDFYSRNLNMLFLGYRTSYLYN